MSGVFGEGLRGSIDKGIVDVGLRWERACVTAGFEFVEDEFQIVVSGMMENENYNNVMRLGNWKHNKLCIAVKMNCITVSVQRYLYTGNIMWS